MQTRNIIFSFLVLLFFFNSCNQQTYLTDYDNLWVSTSRNMWCEAGIFMDLSQKDTLFITKDFDYENLKAHKYIISSTRNLILDDTINYGKIIKQNENILLIEIPSETSLKPFIDTLSFISIKNYNLNIDTVMLKQVLLENDWQLHDAFGSFRLEFLEQPWFVNFARLKTYLRITEETGREMFDAEWWTVDKYKNSYFIILSHYQTEYQIYQIKSFTDSVILAETCWDDSIVTAKFSITKSLSENEYHNISKSIVGSWKLYEYENTVDKLNLYEEEIIPINSKVRIRPFAEEDSVPMILNKFYIEKTIKYEFLENGKCQMKSGNEVLRTADWKLSKDGKYIKFENGWMHNMKIESINDSLLIIGKHETIEFLDDFNWKQEYFIEKLKK
ncbi:MAG TPA: hypothetical protein DCG75_10955 [Bacteroidales bacterium]|nr:hypothetical protein [Bacteroidales bacterium]